MSKGKRVAGASELRLVCGDARLDCGQSLRRGVVALDYDLHLVVERVDLGLQLTSLRARRSD